MYDQYEDPPLFTLQSNFCWATLYTYLRLAEGLAGHMCVLRFSSTCWAIKRVWAIFPTHGMQYHQAHTKTLCFPEGPFVRSDPERT